MKQESLTQAQLSTLLLGSLGRVIDWSSILVIESAFAASPHRMRVENSADFRRRVQRPIGLFLAAGTRSQRVGLGRDAFERFEFAPVTLASNSGSSRLRDCFVRLMRRARVGDTRGVHAGQYSWILRSYTGTLPSLWQVFIAFYQMWPAGPSVVEFARATQCAYHTARNSYEA